MVLELPDNHPAAEALKIIAGDRQNDYGPPERNFQRIADIWAVIFGHEVTPAQVGWCMLGVKMARDVNVPKRDNVVDAIGYAALLGEMLHKEAELVKTIQDAVEIDITDQVMEGLFNFEPMRWYRHKNTGTLWQYVGQFPEGNGKEDRKFVNGPGTGTWFMSACKALDIFVPAGGTTDDAA